MTPGRQEGGDFIELTPVFGTPVPGELAADSTLSDRVVLTPTPFPSPPPEQPPEPPAAPASRRRRLLLILPLGLLAAGVGVYLARDRAPVPPSAPKGRLVVLLAFDFLPGDKLERWAGLFGPDGFERLKADGVWYPDARVPQAFTAAGPGFAGLATGATPSGHGVTDDSAGELLLPTVGDALKASGSAKVFAVGLDDRVRNLAGRSADGVVSLDAESGAFRSVGRSDPGWLAAFNAKRPATRWAGTAWERFRPTGVYDAVAGADRPEGKGGAAQGVRFPHPFGPPDDAAYRDSVLTSPAGNELAWEAAKAAIGGERLGRRGETDLLCVGLTAGGRVMRAWGPESHEAADLLVRADRLIAEAMAFLDAAVGTNRWALVVAGCHGGCPLPEWEKPGRPAGRRFDPAVEFSRLGEAMDEAFGRVDGQPGRWVERFEYPWVMLDRETLAARRVDPAAAATFAAQWLGHRPAALAAYARGQPAGDDPVGRVVAATFHAERGGDVFVVGRPYLVPAAVGSVTGSPHPYDSGVTLLAVGNGVPPLRTQPGRVSVLAATPLLAKLLGVPPPAGAAEPLPAGLE